MVAMATLMKFFELGGLDWRSRVWIISFNELYSLWLNTPYLCTNTMCVYSNLATIICAFTFQNKSLVMLWQMLCNGHYENNCARWNVVICANNTAEPIRNPRAAAAGLTAARGFLMVKDGCREKHLAAVGVDVSGWAVIHKSSASNYKIVFHD